jgi:hypothetical protein
LIHKLYIPVAIIFSTRLMMLRFELLYCVRFYPKEESNRLLRNVSNHPQELQSREPHFISTVIDLRNKQILLNLFIHNINNYNMAVRKNLCFQLGGDMQNIVRNWIINISS